MTGKNNYAKQRDNDKDGKRTTKWTEFGEYRDLCVFIVIYVLSKLCRNLYDSTLQRSKANRIESENQRPGHWIFAYFKQAADISSERTLCRSTSPNLSEIYRPQVNVICTSNVDAIAVDTRSQSIRTAWAHIRWQCLYMSMCKHLKTSFSTSV